MIEDPYLALARKIGYVDHGGPPERFPVSIELRDGVRAADVQPLLAPGGRIEPAYLDRAAHARIVTGSVDEAGLAALAAAHDRIVRFELALPHRPVRTVPRRITAPCVDPAALGPGERADARSSPDRLLAIIDSGCPFAHPLLRRADGGTRIAALWDQDDRPDFGGLGPAPDGFSYGVELRAPVLDALMRAAGGDDAHCYRIAGASRLNPAASHGAHSLGLLAGYGLPPLERPAAPDILFVQLPQTAIAAPSRAALARHVVDGLAWIALVGARARAIDVSIGVGSSLGPHDGSSLVERAITAAADGGRLHPYVAAGNERGARLHAAFELDGARRALRWRIPPACEVASFAEIWLPAGARDADVHVRLTSPCGTHVAEAGWGELALVGPPGACRAAVHVSEWAGVESTMVLLRVAPTAVHGAGPAAPAGDWLVEVAAARPVDGGVARVHVCRVARARGLPRRARPSRLVPSCSGRTVSPAEDGTLQAFASARGAIVVVATVASRADPRAPAAYGSGGTSEPDAAFSPDLAYPGDDAPALRGVRSIGHRAGATVRADGTSAAVARAAGLGVGPPDLGLHGPPDPRHVQAGRAVAGGRADRGPADAQPRPGASTLRD